MKKSNSAGILALSICALFYCSITYGNSFNVNPGSGFDQRVVISLFQDTAAKKAKPTKKAEIDRTKGEAGRGQGKGVDTISTTSDTTGRRNKSEINKGTMDKSDQNSDNRGEGAGKNNRAGNSKKGVDTTRQ